VTNRSAIVLLSGGLDSATVLAIARRDGFSPTALSFDYGQRHRVELSGAAALARGAGVPHLVLPLPLDRIGGSALTDPSIAVPKNELGSEPIPVTYVPARNLLFLSVALSLAEARGARTLFVGANAIDYSGYPDCRPEFLEAFERAANLGTKAGTGGEPFRVLAPLLRMSKAEIVRTAVELGVDLSNTSSCYEPSDAGAPCGACDSCLLRAAGFAEAGVVDPVAAR
jgi:7-cyano-7-deazaguanine synthase